MLPKDMLKQEKLKIQTAFYKSDAIQFKNLSLHLNKFEKENLMCMAS